MIERRGKDTMEIDVTGIDLIQFIKEVYKLSVPAGLGYLHFRDGKMINSLL